MEERGELIYKDLEGRIYYFGQRGETIERSGTLGFGPNTVVIIDPIMYASGAPGFQATIIPYYRMLKAEINYTTG